jgi:hypothetical protein
MMVRDRAAVVMQAILLALDITPPELLRPYLEALLRDEFAAVKREAAAERDQEIAP